MKLIRSFFTILSLAALVVSCGNADNDVDFNFNQGELGQGKPVDDCLGLGENDLILSIQDQFTTLPGKVSIFFKVSDSNGNPVSGLQANQFTIYEQGRNDDCFNTISTSESQARISPNSQIFRNNTLLVLDLSNSVLSSSLEELKSASISFVNNVMPAQETDSYKMAIYWFDGEDKLHLLNPLSRSKTELIASIDGITKDISTDPSTDLYGAVIKSTNIAENLLKESSNDDVIAAASVVVFTDGTDQASRYTEQAAIDKVENADRNISFFSIGLGAEIDADILSQIGKTFSVFAGNKEELETTFNDISFRVSEQASSFYLFEYCSPKRDGSGENNLAIQVKDGNRQGAVQTKFSAKGFTGGCE
ncbi:vWA domain-containing protein [Zeaxanthinibacter enoshimensis]|uniref:von Willebrand factor type A domain-containing protein n=1 Tax=Zeaxanthinibacter enoshimensis TaxID=392009 RepID=A0A4V3D3U5_9FLAO|nr:VWA domain-containing protein [Zeaxanthinibacter enoshimensis]TDQ31403.1 von Willebrand factor type A domain-containing protein [Zeaxanthinibacter enoshimensis]